MIRKAYVSTPDGDIHYRTVGERSPSLVLLQILPFGSQIFTTLLPLLAEVGVSAIALDLMGYGRSDKRNRIWLVEDFAVSVEHALAALEVKPTAILGGHFSGLVATQWVRSQPGWTGKLILDGCPVWSAQDRAGLKDRPSMAPVALDDDGGHMIEYWKRAWGMLSKLNPSLEISPQTSGPIRDAVIALMEASYEPGILDAFAGYDMAEALPQIAVETLIIGAAQDSQSQYFELQTRAIPRSTSHFFPGVHPLHDIARPVRASEYADILIAFLNSPDAS